MNRKALCFIASLLLVGCGQSDEERKPAEPTTGPATAPATQPVALLPAEVQTDAVAPRYAAMAQQDLNEGLAFLLAEQNADGGWGASPDRSHPAITALVLKALVQHPSFAADSPAVARGYAYLLKFQQPDGSIYDPDPQAGQATYTTAVAVMALVAADEPLYQPIIAKAAAYLKGLQVVEGSATPGGETVDKDHASFGGIDYGRSGEPNLSTLQFALEALDAAGVPKSDPVWANAMVFLTRTQNFGENDQPWAAVVNDGGFVYAPNESKAGTVIGAEGRQGLRSYGSMTYAGFKSMLYANVGRDDPRVQAAYEWIRAYWRLDSNPNMPETTSQQGLYYYYHTFAKALRTWGQPVITDTRGLAHNWREELIETLNARQNSDGSWVNSADRWYEGMPVLVTAYAVLALEEALAK